MRTDPPRSPPFIEDRRWRRLAGNLTSVYEDGAPGPPIALLRPRCASARAGGGRRPCRRLQGAGGSHEGRNRESSGRRREVLRLRPHGRVRAVRAHGLTPPPHPPRRGPRGVRAPRDVCVLLARAGGDRPAASSFPAGSARIRVSSTAGRPEVLFVCVHNAGRSQMAAALVTLRGGGRIDVRSAGSAPADEIDPAVVEVMTELGVDLSREVPKPLRDDAVRSADVVITMGCGDACPVYPGKRYEDWTLADPAGRDVAIVRSIRDEIDARVRLLVDELLD